MIKKQFVKYFMERDGLTIESEINNYLLREEGTVKIVSISLAVTTDRLYETRAMVVFERTS